MGNFHFDGGNYQNTGFSYPPSPPDDVFLDCPIHDCSSEDCGCIVDDDGGYEPFEEE
jgi:hypothetical protein